MSLCVAFKCLFLAFLEQKNSSTPIKKVAERPDATDTPITAPVLRGDWADLEELDGIGGVTIWGKGVLVMRVELI